MSFENLRKKLEYYLTWNYLSDSDVHALGLRPISRSKVNRALNVLEQIYERVYENPPKTRKYKKTLTTLSDKYFDIVPATNKMVIDTKSKVAVELATCDYLQGLGVKS